MKMTVKEIVIEWLKANKYDGLLSEDCGCQIDDLMPCSDDCDVRNCVAGVRVEADPETGWDFVIEPRVDYKIKNF